MFRKILLSFFPEDELNNSLSPLKFHFRLIVPKLFYGLSLKHSLSNRRTAFVDTRFSYFVSPYLDISDFKNESFFYSYKNYALINGFDNYGLNILLSTVILVSFTRYFSYFYNKKFFFPYLKIFLFAVNYIILIFFAHFKEYDNQLTKDEKVRFLIGLFEHIVEYLIKLYKLENDFKKIEKLVSKLSFLLQKDHDFLMFLFKTTESVSEHFVSLEINHFDFYKYLIPGMLEDFPNEKEFYAIFSASIKKIFIKRYSVKIDGDIISFSNLLGGEPIHINYITGKENVDFLPYFIKSLDYICDIDILNLSIGEIIDKVLDFKKWIKLLINSLKQFNSDNIDIIVSPDINFQKVQELLSKEALSNVKKISSVNEQFLDFLILLISRRFNSEGFYYQSSPKIYFSNIDLSSELTQKIKKHYVFLDKNYFKWSYFYRTKKELTSPKDFNLFFDKIGIKLIVNQQVEILLEDFNKKSLKLYFPTKEYEELLRKYYIDDIKSLLLPKGYKKYLKLLKLSIKENELKSKQISYFRENIYYPDFIVFYKFLEHLTEISKKFRKKFQYGDYISLALIKQTLLGYKIFEAIAGKNIAISNFYYSAVFFPSSSEIFNLALQNLVLPEKFIAFFVKVHQNKKFVKLIQDSVYSLPEEQRPWFVLDCFRDLNFYNKRTFNI